jgi:hypothetical protein
VAIDRVADIGSMCDTAILNLTTRYIFQHVNTKETLKKEQHTPSATKECVYKCCCPNRRFFFMPYKIVLQQHALQITHLTETVLQ